MLAALLFAAALVVPEFARETIEGTAPLPGAKLVVQSYVEVLPDGCVANEASVALLPDRDGRLVLRLIGQGCTGIARASVRWSAAVPVTDRPVALGEALAPAVHFEDRDVTGLRKVIGTLPEGAVAARSLRAGWVLTQDDARAEGPRPGDDVPVVVNVGGIAVRETGRVVPCTLGRMCALLPGGRRVEGRYEAGQLVVEVR